jgi:hypothetical protein
MIAWWLKKRGIPGRLTLVDAGGGMQRFNRIFAERYPDQIRHLTYATVKALDPFAKSLQTEFDDIRFDDAIIIPPQGAADIVRQAGCSKPMPPAGPAPGLASIRCTCTLSGDERVFLVGDLLGRASPLFGAYPKSAHMAARLGRIAAEGIVARLRGVSPAPTFPESLCFVHTDVEPAEALRIEASYRQRGDGLVMQTVRQWPGWGGCLRRVANRDSCGQTPMAAAPTAAGHRVESRRWQYGGCSAEELVELVGSPLNSFDLDQKSGIKPIQNLPCGCRCIGRWNSDTEA